MEEGDSHPAVSGRCHREGLLTPIGFRHFPRISPPDRPPPCPKKKKEVINQE